MKTLTRNLLIGTALAAISVGAIAGPGMGGRFGDCDKRQGGHGPMGALSQLDNLTDQQRDQLSTLRNNQRDAMRATMQAMRDGRQELRDAVHNGADDATITAIAEKNGDIATAMMLQFADMKKQIDAILTEEQRQQLADSGYGMRDKIRDHRHMGMGW